MFPNFPHFRGMKPDNDTLVFRTFHAFAEFRGPQSTVSTLSLLSIERGKHDFHKCPDTLSLKAELCKTWNSWRFRGNPRFPRFCPRLFCKGCGS